jgi:hypothetical protein
MMSVSPSSRKRKARESNPHHLLVARISSAARQTVSGYLPFVSGPTGNRTRISATPGRCRPVGPSARISVDRMGVEPIAPTLQGSVAPHRHAGPFVERSVRGLSPVFRLTTAACGHNTYRPFVASDPG